MANNKADTWETGLLNLLLLNTAFAGVGDAGGLLPSSVAGSLYLSLHYADPGEAGSQTTSEASYASYARKAIARSGAGFSVTGDTGTNVADLDFPKATGTEPNGSGLLAFWGLGTASSGAGKLLYHGSITSALATTPVISGIIPRVEAGALTIQET